MRNPFRNALAVTLLLLLWIALTVATFLDWSSFHGISGRLNYWVLALATTSAAASLARSLPLQNVLLSMVLVALMGIAIEIASSGELVPFDQLWPALLLWIVASFSCRGVARLMVGTKSAPARRGVWVLATAVLLMVLLLMSFAKFGPVRITCFSQAFAGRRVDAEAARAFVACAVGSVAILLVITPILIYKRPGLQPVDWHPLFLWIALNLWCAASALRDRAWLGAGLLVAGTTAVGLIATPRGLHPKGLALETTAAGHS